MAFGRAEGPGQGGWDAEAADGEGVDQPFARAGGRSGMGLVEVAGQGLEGCLGAQGIGVVVGGSHLLGHQGSERRRELRLDVADLVFVMPIWA